MNHIRLHPNLLTVLSVFLLFQACTPPPAPTPFIPPTRQATPVSPQPVDTPTGRPSPISTVISFATNTPDVTNTPEPPCTNNLSFITDLNVPDGTAFQHGASIDKQWLVRNSGTCNWDSSYRLKLVNGDALGAASEQALFPARAGSQVKLQVTFIAPNEPGTYGSAWQAIDPNGEPFGDAFYLQIVVQAEAQITVEVTNEAQ